MNLHFAAPPLTALALLIAGVSAQKPAVPPFGATVPIGATIPIELRQTLDAGKLQVGDLVRGRTVEVVTVNNGVRIPAGSAVLGRVVDVGRQARPEGASTLAIEYDSVRWKGGTLPLRVGVRAVASFMKSYSSREAALSNDQPAVSLYKQIGGDYYYPDSTVYSAAGVAVGRSTHDGIVAQLTRTQPADGRDGIVCDASAQPQAVGEFSASACGLYGFDDLVVRQTTAGAEPVRIEFSSANHSVKLGAWTTMLLQVEPER